MGLDMIRRTRISTAICVLAAASLAGVALAEPADARVSFQRDIRPILAKNCLSCHGPDESSRQAKLRLDTRAGATGEDGGHAGIVPGDSAKSRVVVRISSADLPMPPKGAGELLSSGQVELIRRWIDQGATYDRHWAFEPPVRFPAAQVRDAEWPKNEMDSFVLARLDGEGLSPSPEASRAVLIRRVYLDLIGLPPSIEQVEAFVNDTEPGAYERVVNEVFNSPHYGERWARVWLDMARYADSKGYEADRLRTIWPYRDWVIRALNENMPFDRFTVIQLAGDLLPVPTRDQLIATGFHRNTMSNDEGETDNEEFRDLAVKDRVATTGQIWMGMSWGCAQCHSHKYDPISHKEFYQLYAFFNQTEDSDKVEEEPLLDLGDDTKTLIMRELASDKRRETRILLRGNFLDKGERVEAATPAVFHPPSPDAPLNRLGLAKWLTDKANPLTARVTANRFWARLFGAGLVESEEDFGTQGLRPSHPKLLDWLATEFMRLDWDMKAIQKTIVISATYRQSSDATAELAGRDPYNRLLARGPRVRLDAEMIRDQMLAVSGLLSTKMYGPPVMPLQPDGVWQVVYNGDRWQTSDGEDRYRRALYTLWRRTSPYPAATTFDAPTGELCTPRRIRTNTPLQALVTLNDPVALEAAQHMARRVLRDGGATFGERLNYAFRLALSRGPREEELARLGKLHQKAARDLGRDQQAARDLLHADRVIYRGDRVETLIARAEDTEDTAEGAAPDTPPDTPVVWRYRTSEPPADWAVLEFNDSTWKQGPAMFGKDKRKKEKDDDDDDGLKINTPWDSERLWLRRAFEVPVEAMEDFRAIVNFRGAFAVYVNGVLAAESLESSAGTKHMGIYSAARKTIRVGRNVLAIAMRRSRDGDGAQYIDAGLEASRPPDFEPRRPDDAERAAWVIVSHVLLNLDELLTKR